MIDTAKIKANILSCAFKGMLVDFNVEKSNEALDELHKENKKYVPVKEDEYLTEVPSRWQWSRLGYVTNNHGQKEPQEDFCYIDVGTLDNINHCLAKKENLFNKEEAPSRARKIVEQGDVLYSTVRPYLHNICIINKDFSRMPVASTAFCVMAVEEKVLINKYLFYWLLSPEFDKFSNGNPSKGTLYPAIGEKDLLNGVIPIPDIEEQKLIVEKLDSAFEHLDKLNRLQTLYTSDLEVLKSKIIDAGIQGKLTEQHPEDGTAKELLEQIAKEKKQLIKEKKINATKDVPPVAEDDIPFVIPSNWSWVRFNDIANIVGTGMIRSGQEQYDEADYYYFKMNNIENFTGKCDFSNMTMVNASDDEYGKYKLEEGDFLFNTRNSAELVGKTAVVHNLPSDKILLNNNILKVLFFGNICPDYINYFFISRSGRRQLEQFITSTTNVAAIYQRQIITLAIPLPPVAEQIRIVEKINQILVQI